MSEVVKKIINLLVKKPEKLFLVDSIGALLTAFFLFVVLRNFHEYFGMPQRILTYLAITALTLCVYSAACFLFLKDNWIPYIRVISIANVLYCTLTMLLLVFYYPVLTALGILYFLVEIALICGLVYIELKVVAGIKKS